MPVVCLNMFTMSGKQLLSWGTEQWRFVTMVPLALTRTVLEKHERLSLTVTDLSILDRVTFIQERRVFPARKRQLHYHREKQPELRQWPSVGDSR